ncbi:Two-component response regulator SSK1p [Malassezia vespertilionis]|uniref:Ssk1p n=1 Tax=Malassezia vespertilionis TaxID=2020962 RepID=A0A2N1J7Q2_9BASI|nr:Two-component response regulator SSK1p [Malassezia vespertilionis]PKI82581.1 Ssk1p [Malassezia vespertilionis]WFD08495.1 Two-component response regulator SSK1p [Malassezia vespertilionis]
MPASPYQLLTQTLLQCIDSTLQTLWHGSTAQMRVSVCAPTLQAVAHTSAAVQWFGAWFALSAAHPEIPATHTLVLKESVHDMVQVACDAVASSAAQHRVELFLTAAETGDASPGLLQRQAQGGEVVPWYPSNNYSMAAHTVLVYILSWVVHLSAEDACAVVLPITFGNAYDVRIDLFFDATSAPDATAWPAWLGTQADLQRVLDDFGMMVTQTPLPRAELAKIPQLAPLRDARHATYLQISLHKPRSVDLVSPAVEAPLAGATTLLQLVRALPLEQMRVHLAERRVCVVPRQDRALDPLAHLLQSCLQDWGCTVCSTVEAPGLDVCVLHDNVRMLQTCIKLGVAVVYFAPSDALEYAAAQCGDEARAVFLPTPVGKVRFLWALFHAICSYDPDQRLYRTRTGTELRLDASPDGTEAHGSLAPTPRVFSPKTHSPDEPRSLADAHPEAPVEQYLTQAVSQLTTQDTTSEGVVVRSEDGCTAGLFFSPSDGHAKEGGARKNTCTPRTFRTEPLQVALGRADSSSGQLFEPTSLVAEKTVQEYDARPTLRQIQLPPLDIARSGTPDRMHQDDDGPLPDTPHGPSVQFSRSHARTSALPQPGLLIGAATARPSTPPSLAVGRTGRRSIVRDATFLPPVKVLIVEDNVINQRILSMFLRKKHIKYEIAKDGREAIEKWREGDFHLILMDIQLPVLDGIAATKEIRRLETLARSTSYMERTPVPRHSVIIVALTASVLDSDRVAALAAGCNDYLNKPVSLTWLQRKILEWGSMQYLLHAGQHASVPHSPSAYHAQRSIGEAIDRNAQRAASHLQLRLPPAKDHVQL